MKKLFCLIGLHRCNNYQGTGQEVNRTFLGYFLITYEFYSCKLCLKNWRKIIEIETEEKFRK